MKTLFVRIAPKAGPEKFFRCGMEFSRTWTAVNDLDKATVERLETEQMLETSDAQPAGYTPAETAAEAPAAGSAEKLADAVTTDAPVATPAKAKK